MSLARHAAHTHCVALQIHYNNPLKKSGTTDSSGLVLEISDTVRENDAGVPTFPCHHQLGLAAMFCDVSTWRPVAGHSRLPCAGMLWLDVRDFVIPPGERLEVPLLARLRTPLAIAHAMRPAAAACT